MPKAKKDNQLTSSQIKQLQQRTAELTQALQHERADAVNLRRRHEEEISNLHSRLKANVVRELLPVIDNFERALKHVPKNLENDDYIKGVQSVVKQFEKTLEQMGVERIKTAVGESFNPHLHEAVSMDEGSPGSDSEQATHEIVSEELQPGYKLGDDVLRHAMVRVKLK